ncbi:hypothetical protein [Rodentibacter pneumotropicus]|nr:hypothetical protein [Rodentibacter pneumotropicus]
MSIKRIKIALLTFVFIGLAWHLELGNDYDGKMALIHRIEQAF